MVVESGGVTMSAIPVRRLTEEEYLELEDHNSYKSEFYDGIMYPIQAPPGVLGMAGASLDHNQIKDNLAFELNSRLLGGPCRTLSSDVKVRIETTKSFSYPDVVVFCGPPVFPVKKRRDVISNPMLIVEVLSDSTEEYDRGGKFDGYKSLPTLREYVLVAQSEVKVERFVRQPDDSWAVTEYTDPLGSLPLTSVPADIPLAAVYRHVEFTENAPPV
jgi:Uma2 family endonuclease